MTEAHRPPSHEHPPPEAGALVEGARKAAGGLRGEADSPSKTAPPQPQVRLKGAPDGGLLTPQLQPVLDALPYYVLLIDAEHTILMANEAVKDALGVSPSTILGGYCPKVVHGLDGPFAGCPLEEALAGDGCFECELAEHDHVVNSGVYPTPYETPDGKPVFLHVTQDITAQRHAEQRVERTLEAQRLVNDLLRVALEPGELEEILQRVVDRIVAVPWLAASPRGAILLTDETSRILRLTVHHGLEPALQRTCSIVPFGRCLCGRAAETGTVQFAGEVNEHHDHLVEGMAGHGHYCVPIVHGGEVLGVLSTVVDEGHERDQGELDFLTAIADVLAGIIQRKRAEELTREHQRVALSRERMARVGEVSAGVAHTVRNPLHGVLSCVEILEGHAKRGEPVSLEMLALMRDGLHRIEKVTRRLLALTREAEPTRRPTRVGTLLDDVRDLLALQAEAKGVTLQIDAWFEGQAMLNADRVVEGLSGVVSNAIDACKSGDCVTVRSRITHTATPTLLLEVEDTGAGIPEKHLAQVLDPFFTTKPIGEGSGLGLAITRRVMDEHEGDVQITSKPGQGTVVRMLFPNCLADAAPHEPP